MLPRVVITGKIIMYSLEDPTSLFPGTPQLTRKNKASSDVPKFAKRLIEQLQVTILHAVEQCRVFISKYSTLRPVCSK